MCEPAGLVVIKIMIMTPCEPGFRRREMSFLNGQWEVPLYRDEKYWEITCQ